MDAHTLIAASVVAAMMAITVSLFAADQPSGAVADGTHAGTLQAEAREK